MSQRGAAMRLRGAVRRALWRVARRQNFQTMTNLSVTMCAMPRNMICRGGCVGDSMMMKNADGDDDGGGDYTSQC